MLEPSSASFLGTLIGSWITSRTAGTQTNTVTCCAGNANHGFMFCAITQVPPKSHLTLHQFYFWFYIKKNIMFMSKNMFKSTNMLVFFIINNHQEHLKIPNNNKKMGKKIVVQLCNRTLQDNKKNDC